MSLGFEGVRVLSVGALKVCWLSEGATGDLQGFHTDRECLKDLRYRVFGP